MSRWWVRVAVSAAVTLILLWIVPLDEVWAAIQRVDPWVWGGATGVFLAGQSLNAMKLRVLLGPERAPASACLRAHFAGVAANLGLPGVAGGDLVRAAALVPVAGTAPVALAAVADRLVDTVALVLLVLAAAPVAGMPPVLAGQLRATLGWLAGIGLVLVVGGVMAARWFRRRPGLPRLAEAWAGLRIRPGAIALAMAISMGVQCGFVLTNVWLAGEVGLVTPIAPWFLAWTAARLSALLPISMGGLGVREAALVALLGAYGVEAEGALAVGLLWDAALITGSLGGFMTFQSWRSRTGGGQTS